MRSKTKWALAMGICGILILLTAFALKGILPNKADGILFGLGSMLAALGCVRFLVGRFEVRNPGLARMNEI